MRLLDRYLMRELLLPFFYCIIGFYIFCNFYDLSDKIRELQRQRLNALDIAEYYAVKAPEFMVRVIPVAFLLALLYALTNHARHQELTAMRAAGVSLARIAAPYLLVGFLLSLGVGLLNELWVPRSVEATDAILARYVAPKKALKEWERGFNFTNFRDKRQWFIQAYHRHRDEMVQPHVFWESPDKSRHEISSERAGFHAGQWYFTNAQELIYPPPPATDPVRVQSDLRVMSELNETPRQIKAQMKISKIDSFRTAYKTQLSIKEILDYKKWNPGRSPRGPMLDTKLHERIAMPWMCLVIVLIALPFGAATGRRNVFVGVASSILICFAYIVLQQLSLALGSAGYLPAPLAAWVPNLIFAATGFGLTWRRR